MTNPVKTYAGGKPNRCEPSVNRLEILQAVYGDTVWHESALTALTQVIELACQAERKRCIARLMAQHDTVRGMHNYWQHAALMLEADA
jgi:hypothetical protein